MEVPGCSQMSTEGCKGFAVDQRSLPSVSFLPLLVQTLWPQVSFCFFGMIQISLFLLFSIFPSFVLLVCSLFLQQRALC